MARITVEDCLDHVENRFQLVLVATKRVRQLMIGAEPQVDKENDKPTVVALREIAGGFVTSAILDAKAAPAEVESDDDTSEQGETSAGESSTDGQEGTHTQT